MATGETQDWKQVFSHSPYALLQPSPALHNSLLHLAKQFLDPLAADVTNAQIGRQKSSRISRKRKRRHAENTIQAEELLRMKQVYVNGFDVDQVWQQAKRVLGAAAAEIERELPEEEDASLEDNNEGRPGKSVTFDEDGFEVEASDDLENLSSDQEGEDMEDGIEYDDGDIEQLDGEDFGAEDEDSVDIGEETPSSEVSEDESGQEALVKDKFGLNDGFFSIDQFNKQTQFLENQDARGDPNDGAASDEEDVDWEANPLEAAAAVQTSFENKKKHSQAASKRSNQVDDLEVDEEDDEDEADGPTFGNMDLDAPEGASDGDEDLADDDEDGLIGGDFANTNNVMYTDFFAPPAKKQGQKKNASKARTTTARSNHDTTKQLNGSNNDDEDELERTMSRVHRDLYEDDLSEASGTEDTPAVRQNNQSNPPRNINLSTHERTQLALRDEIRKLEAENIASKPWYLSGEAVADIRPINSLLEEDLDFERAGKPVPVITEEISESIEDLIKRRILAREFDEVVRRRPNDLATGPDARWGRVREELADTKPTKGLAEEYEAEHLKRTDPNFVDTRNEATKVAHREIEVAWAKVSAQLDALSNWHYKPKPPSASLEVRVNAPTISLEDARPTTGGEVGGASLLAPQEVYKAGEEGKKEGHVLTKGGLAVAKEEETREAKQRRRAREKERMRKAGGNADKVAAEVKRAKGVKEGKKAPRDEVVKQLKRGGARIIDNKGGVRDVEGNAVREGVVIGGASSFKL